MVDTSPIEVANLRVGDQCLKATPPLEFHVSFENDAACYTLEGDFEIYLYAFSRKELESVLFEHLEFIWLDYALEEDEAKLAPSGLKLKSDLLDRFSKD